MALAAPADLLRRAALRYAEEGWGVIPLHSPIPDATGLICDCRKGAACESPAKHPWTRNGLKDASKDMSQVDAWWRAWPGANIGLVLRPQDVVVDIDSEDALNRLMTDTEFDIPDTWNVTTGKGWHYIYQTDEPVKGTVGIIPGVDLRGYGNYIVAPPSVHISGRVYRQNSSMKQRTNAPAWIGARPKTATTDGEPSGPIPQGKRNGTLASLAGRLRRGGSDQTTILAALRAENLARCVPPLPADEVERIAASVARYAPEPEAPRLKLVTDLEEVELKWRTLNDISDEPPGELLLGMLEPDGPTLMYALGGTGKGSTGAWMLGELIGMGRHPIVYDAENRPKEWARRASGLGVPREEVIYLQPTDLPRGLMGKPLWEITDYIGRVAAATGRDILLVDSIMPAVGVGEDKLRSDAQVPYLYVQALDALGIPSVSFGHPPKGQPEGEPFGSVAWVNAMRLTWNGTQAEGDGHRVRWRPRKRNERGFLHGWLFEFEYLDGRLVNVYRKQDEEATRDWLLSFLAGGPKTISEMVAAVMEQYVDPPLNQEIRERQRFSKALHRNPDFRQAGPKTRDGIPWEIAEKVQLT